MQNGENDPLSLPFANKDTIAVDNKLFVAATVAAVVLAGSAIAYRHVATNTSSTMRLFWKDSRAFEEELENEKTVEGTVGPDAEIGLRKLSTTTTIYTTGQDLEHTTTNSPITSKSSRSKDRRKRGKDPLREVLKSGKKLKSFPNPAGSSSIPSSPTPPAAILTSSLVGQDKRVGENTELYSSFGPGSSLGATQLQLLDTSHYSPESRIRLEKTPATPATSLSAEEHSRDVSQLSRCTHDEDDDFAGDEDADLPGRSSCRQCAHRHSQSPNSLSQSSLSLPRSLSSLGDVFEDEPEVGSWVTSVSKSHSKHRASLENVIFGDVRTESGGLGRDGLGNQARYDGMAKAQEKTRGYMDQGPDEGHSNATPIFRVEETSTFSSSNEAIAFLSADLPLHASCSDTNSENGDPHQLHNLTSSQLPSPLINPSSEKNKSKARRAPIRGKQESQQEPTFPTHWNTTTPSQSTPLPANFGTRDMSNDAPSADTEDDDDRKNSRFRTKGSSGTSYTSFSSAVTGGAGGKGGSIVIGQCQTVSVTAAVVGSRMSISGSGLTETDDVSCPSASTGDGELEFTFPTLNSQATTSSSGPSTRARSTLIGTSVSSSSPSKKNKRFLSNKSGTPPPNGPHLRTSSPSNTWENHTAGYSKGHNASGGSTPALSAQTQLASLRGALEAARLREEKHKTEMENITKELELLKWESTNCRRGEVELQAQVRQLTHQLQSYATLFASVAPHLNSHLAFQSHPQANGPGNSLSDVNPGSSPTVDPNVELPNGGDNPSSPDDEKKLEVHVAEAQEDEAVSPSDIPAPPPTQQPSQLPAHVNDIPSPLAGARHPLSPPLSAAIPTFFPYYLPAQHPHFPVHHSPWMYHHYQPQQSTQNVSGTAGGPSSPPPPRLYSNVYSPTMYPISPVHPPLSPQGIGVMSPQLLHQYHPFGFGGGLRSAGASSAGSHSPDLTGSATGLGSGLNKPRSRIRRRKSQITNLNGNARAGWEDVGDGWIGLSKVVPPTTNVDKGRITDEGTMADGEGEDDNIENASSPYSELLADAILKRSSTIRPSKKNGKKENSALVSQEGAEEVEEFTFPSLSDVSNAYYRTASRTESSISSSLSSSPPSTTATVPDLLGDPGWEEDKASLPPVVEKAEDSDPYVSDMALQGPRLDMPSSKLQDIMVNEQATPKKDDHEQSLTDSLEQ